MTKYGSKEAYKTYLYVNKKTKHRIDQLGNEIVTQKGKIVKEDTSSSEEEVNSEISSMVDNTTEAREESQKAENIDKLQEEQQFAQYYNNILNSAQML